jgi:hypothetical protein
MPTGAASGNTMQASDLRDSSGMANDIRNWRRALWTCAATAVVIVAGCDRMAAQELVATTAMDDSLDNATGLLPAPASAAASQAGQAVIIPSSSQRATQTLTPLARWVDVQTGTMAARFRFTETSAGVVTQDQLQHSEQIKARVKVDPSGAYAVGFALGTGNEFVRGWNNTQVGSAAGTPDGYASNIFVKQLFASAAPANGIEIQAGGLGIVKGENTEITSYDNDGYIVGERVSVKRPRTFHVDELSVTMAYLGDSKTASLWPRLHRLEETNYYQVFAARRFGSRLGSSADITTVAGATTLRNGLSVKTPELRIPTSIRFEHYARLNAAYGFSICGERTVGKWTTLSAGWVDIDQQYGGLNSDRFGSGRRWFTTDTISLGRELSVQIFYQHAVANAYALSNRRSLQMLLTYNVAKGLQRTGVL